MHKATYGKGWITAFGPGKLILLGEHGVVYGHPALAAPISRGVWVRAKPANELKLQSPPGLSPAQQDALNRAFTKVAACTKCSELSIHLDSDLPLSVGLGSSGALAVAVSRVLLEARYACPPDTRHVEELALEMEKEFHGTPSGVDHITSSRGTMIVYQGGHAREVQAKESMKMLVALVGPRQSTSALVESLRRRYAEQPAHYEKLFMEMARLVGDGVEATTRGDFRALGIAMNHNQDLLRAIGLSSERIEAMIHRLRSMGALGAKLTGGGGDGGAVIGLFVDPEHAVTQLRQEGIDCFTSQLLRARVL